MGVESIAVILFLLFIALPIIVLIKFPTLRQIVGFICIIVGLLASATFVGAIFGIPTLIIGATLYITGKNKNQQKNVRKSTKIQVRCSNCKKLNDEDAGFCQHCGEKII